MQNNAHLLYCEWVVLFSEQHCIFFLNKEYTINHIKYIFSGIIDILDNICYYIHSSLVRFKSMTFSWLSCSSL